jgi:4-hydroxyproline epimerase
MEYYDTNTGGEITRIIWNRNPQLETGNVLKKKQILEENHDDMRHKTFELPPDYSNNHNIVGAYMCGYNIDKSTYQVIYFNKAGYLGMCGHGTIGVCELLKKKGMIYYGKDVYIDTLAGKIKCNATKDNKIVFENVPSWRWKKEVPVWVHDLNLLIVGDIVWSGNWFFLIHQHDYDISLKNIDELIKITSMTRIALKKLNITGRDDKEIDHIELLAQTKNPAADVKNFVMCPDGEYSRSPCGTGTSAHIACLCEDNLLAENEEYTVESITGSMFTASYIIKDDGLIYVSIKGSADILG